MATEISHNPDGSMTLSVRFFPGASMLESELNLQAALNEAGAGATGECLRRFDTDGSKIQVGTLRLTSKGLQPKTYQTPYGPARIARHVYQSGRGGATFCPLDVNARVMRTATPLFAKQVSFKYANSNAATVVTDFAQHGRDVARSYVGEVADDVASVARDKQWQWTYALPDPPPGERIKTIAIGVDGTCGLIAGEGWRQVMVGTLAFYNEAGERLWTIYVASAPEAGRATFFAKMERELELARARFPAARWAGVADGAHDLWSWLETRCTWQVVDFWHASEYLAAAAPGMRRGEPARSRWLEEACHRLKHEPEAVASLIRELEEAKAKLGGKSPCHAALDRAISYFTNHEQRMNYHLYRAMGLPIGSGVTEAACKSVVKERLCGSGMKWTSDGAENTLTLRALTKSGDRWEQFWQKTSRFGFAKINAPKRMKRRKMTEDGGEI
jgi:hypothetical protein